VPLDYMKCLDPASIITNILHSPLTKQASTRSRRARHLSTINTSTSCPRVSHQTFESTIGGNHGDLYASMPQVPQVREQDVSVQELVGQIQELSLSKSHKGFLDLPGGKEDMFASTVLELTLAELRNEIYAYHLSRLTLFSTAVALTSTCRQVRSEFRPLYLKDAEIRIPLYRVNRFLSTFFSTTPTSEKNDPACNVVANITADSPCDKPIIDMQWLIGFLLAHPGVNIVFEGDNLLDWEAKDLAKLIELVRSNPK
jgi:hypothetical protein